MKKLPVILIAAAALSANAATVRTATEAFVTNRVAAAANAATNYTDAAVAAIPEPDYSPTNAALRATIEALAPVPGDYENISNRVMKAISLPGDEGHHPSIYTPVFKGRANLADGALELTKSSQVGDSGSLKLRQREQESDEGLVSFVWWPSFLDAWNAWHWVASEDYVEQAANAATNYTAGSLSQFAATGRVDWAERAATIPGPERDWNGEGITHEFDKIERDLAEKATPAAVTNIVRDLSLGGIWDAELEVWWTPVMSNGSLTYWATTNVNLNAEAKP